jgi:lysophospholipase L1-like esterase
MAIQHTHISPRHNAIRIIGRTADFAPDEVRMGFPGITIQFAYRGPAPTVLFGANSADCYFDLQCNDWEPTTFRLAEGRCELALPTGVTSDLPNRIEIVRRNESWQGVASFYGLLLPEGGELTPLPAAATRRMLFIGDSITGGAGLERLPPVPDVTHRSSNARRSFGWLLGKWLNAEVHLVCYGGRGLVRDWQGLTDIANAPQFFQLALPDDPSIPWDHTLFLPQAIVICLATNDFNQGLLDEATYTAAYLRFIEAIRTAHPAAAIILAESPMFGETPGSDDWARRALLRRCLDKICVERKLVGDGKITVAPVSHFPGTSADSHPVAFQHEQIALSILPVLRQMTAW